MGGYYYRPSEEPPRPPSGGNPLVWALMGASVMMVIVALLLVVFLPRAATPPRPAPGPSSLATSTAPGAPESVAAAPISGSPVGLPTAPGLPPPTGRQSRPLPTATRYPSRAGGAQAAPEFIPSAPNMSTAGSSVPAAPVSSEYRQPAVPELPLGSPQFGADPSFARSNLPRATYRPAVSPAPGGAQAQEVIARVKNCVVLLIVQDRRGNIFSGSGFPIGGNQIGTCAHVVEDAARILIAAPGGLRAWGQVFRADPASDVAVVSAFGRIPPPLALGNFDTIRDGDEIAATGYPDFFRFLDDGYAITPSTTRGTVSAKRVRQVGPGVFAQQLQIDAALNHGNSGGPVYSTRDGAVYGLAASTVVGRSGMNFASSIDALRRLAGR